MKMKQGFHKFYTWVYLPISAVYLTYMVFVRITDFSSRYGTYLSDNPVFVLFFIGYILVELSFVVETVAIFLGIIQRKRYPFYLIEIKSLPNAFLGLISLFTKELDIGGIMGRVTRLLFEGFICIFYYDNRNYFFPKKVASPQPVLIEKMFCTQCGYELESDSLFCSRCGKKVDRNLYYQN